MENESALFQKIIPILTEWYKKYQRDLPWRRFPTAYGVWISESMLQQTRIETVIPYYERFMLELPTVEALACADDNRLMKLWEGLGYYSRVRNLKKAAQMIVSDFGGNLPETAEQLKKLPGIGEYTAGAIASLAFGKPEPAVDGNVLRVIMRLTACPDDILSQKTKQTVTQCLREVYPSGNDSAALTQGLMELGETVCLPNGEPKCGVCPLSADCRAHQRNETALYPVRSPKRGRKMQERTVFLLCRDEKYAIRRRGNSGLLAGLWEFPGTEDKKNLTEAESYLREQGISFDSCEPCGEAKHIFTHIEWHMNGYFVRCTAEDERFIWKTPSEIKTDYALPSAFRFYLKYILS